MAEWAGTPREESSAGESIEINGEDRPDGNPQHDQVGYDHRRLVSLLDEDDLALARTPHDARDESAYSFDPDADPDGTFPQSVCSGGPTPEGVLLWTRVAPSAYDPEEPLAVEVAPTSEFEEIAYHGVVDHSEVVRAHDHTVKVDLDGQLEPGRSYHYRFVHDGVASRIGRCRTLPAPDSSPESVSFAVMTCQNYANGYYPAYGYVAEEDVDFIVHVGDFIYESGEGHFKRIGSRDYDDRGLELPSGNGHTHTLADYRYLYRTYRSDRFLQRALERHTLIPAWDDHEIADDIYWDPAIDAPRADHPLSGDPEAMTRLTADAMHAWWEFMPARVRYHPDAEGLQDRFELWRQFEFGDLVDLLLTDERLFRDPPKQGMIPTREAVAPKYEPADRSMLGDDQREWLVEEATDGDAMWTVWCDEVLTMPFKLGAGPLTLFPVQGGWDGYVRERREIMEAFADDDVTNFVTLTGDAHCYIAGYQQTRYDDTLPGLLLGSRVPEAEKVGVEFMTPTVSSLNVAEAIGLNRWKLPDYTEGLLSWLIEACNPHLDFFNSHRWGYSTVEFTREDCVWTAYSVDKTENSMDAERELVRRYRVPEGRVELQDVTE